MKSFLKKIKEKKYNIGRVNYFCFPPFGGFFMSFFFLFIKNSDCKQRKNMIDQSRDDKQGGCDETIFKSTLVVCRQLIC